MFLKNIGIYFSEQVEAHSKTVIETIEHWSSFYPRHNLFCGSHHSEQRATTGCESTSVWPGNPEQWFSLRVRPGAAGFQAFGQMCLWVGPLRQYCTEYLHCSEALSLAYFSKSVFLTAFSQTSACLGITWELLKTQTSGLPITVLIQSVGPRPENLHFWPGRDRGRRDCLLCGYRGSKLSYLWLHCRDSHTGPSCQPQDLYRIIFPP